MTNSDDLYVVENDALTVALKNLNRKGFMDMPIDPTLDLVQEIKKLKKDPWSDFFKVKQSLPKI